MKSMKRTHGKSIAAVAIVLMMVLTACAGNEGVEKAVNNEIEASTAEIEATDNGETIPVNSKEEPRDEAEENQSKMEEEQMLKIQVGDHVLYAEFEDNSSAEALREKLANEPLTLNMHDYGNFEKVSDLPWTLPRNDSQITTEPGDVILHLGNELTIYYDTNSWSFTRVAKIKDADGETLREILGKGNVTVTFSVQ